MQILSVHVGRKIVSAFWDEWSKRKYLDETTANLLALPRITLHEQLSGVDSFINQLYVLSMLMLLYRTCIT